MAEGANLDIIAEYQVEYLGGHPGIQKAGTATLRVCRDDFRFKSMSIVIPYESVLSVRQVRKPLPMAAQLIGMTRDQMPMAHLHIAFTHESGQRHIVQMEMFGMAAVQEQNIERLLETLSLHGIMARFSGNGGSGRTTLPQGGPPLDVAALKQLKELKDSGILTDEEFATEKARILSQGSLQARRPEAGQNVPRLSPLAEGAAADVKASSNSPVGAPAAVPKSAPVAVAKQEVKPWGNGKMVFYGLFGFFLPLIGFAGAAQAFESGRSKQAKTLLAVSIVGCIFLYAVTRGGKSAKGPTSESGNVAVGGLATAGGGTSGGSGSEFVARLANFAAEYEKSPNEIKKSEVFRTAREFGRTFMAQSDDKVNDWKGTLEAVKTSKGGDEIFLLWVKVGDPKSPFTVRLKADDDIARSSPTYAMASAMREGDCVVFSAKIDPEEKSMSESGAMEAPEFNAEFSSLRACR